MRRGALPSPGHWILPPVGRKLKPRRKRAAAIKFGPLSRSFISRRSSRPCTLEAAVKRINYSYPEQLAHVVLVPHV